MITSAAFPVLYLKIPIKIVGLSTFAQNTLAMIISHKALHKMAHLLGLIPVSSYCLLGMLLKSQGVKDANLPECKYATTYDKGGKGTTGQGQLYQCSLMTGQG